MEEEEDDEEEEEIEEGWQRLISMKIQWRKRR